MKRKTFSTLCMAASLATTACAHKDATKARPPASFEAGSVCSAIGPLDDMSLAMRGGTTPQSTEGIFALAWVEEELGYVNEALAELQLRDDGRSAELRERLRGLSSGLQARRDNLAGALGDVQQSHREVSARLERAAHCGEIDLRTKVEDNKAEGKRRRGRKSRCTEARRLWSVVQTVNLSSSLHAGSMAGHLTELTLKGESATLRDELSQWLTVHAARLELFVEAQRDALDGPTAGLYELRNDVYDELAQVRVQCLEALPLDEVPPAQAASARESTVVVMPKWSADSKTRTPGSPFGSGFVVRWPRADGSVATRIVTNYHVLSGASEAEIAPGDALDEDEPKASPIVAKLVRALPHDDVAILEVDDVQQDLDSLGAGVGLRLHPAREQERVVAAGFPGLAGRPSFQVSEGIVSNARFGSEATDPNGVAGYVQHTAAIDPGNSGGPLLDAAGLVLGMNTFEVGGRDNVALAIPAPRIGLAMLRADEPITFNEHHATAACNVVAGALAAEQPDLDQLDRFGVALAETMNEAGRSAAAAKHRAAVQGEPQTALQETRIRLYAAVRSRIEVTPHTTCSEIRLLDKTEGTYTATLPTTAGVAELTFRPETGALRLTQITHR